MKYGTWKEGSTATMTQPEVNPEDAKAVATYLQSPTDGTSTENFRG
jgi:hypothetical protein